MNLVGVNRQVEAFPDRLRDVGDAKLSIVDSLFRYRNDRAILQGVALSLVRLLADTDRDVRIESADILLHLTRGLLWKAFVLAGGSIDLATKMINAQSLASRVEAIMVLADYGTINLGPLVSHSPPSIRCAAVIASALFRVPDAPELSAFLLDESSDVRETAALALDSINDYRAVPAIASVLRDDDYHVRCRALLAIGNILHSESVEPRVWFRLMSAESATDTSSERVTLRAQDVPDALIDAIANCLRDPIARVRQCAATALRRMGPPAHRSLPALVEALREENPQARHAMIEAIGALRSDSRTAVLQLLDILRQSDAFTCFLIKQTLISLLRQILPAKYASIVDRLFLLPDEEPLLLEREVSNLLAMAEMRKKKGSG
jgi:HEAT repeat protein